MITTEETRTEAPADARRDLSSATAVLTGRDVRVSKPARRLGIGAMIGACNRVALGAFRLLRFALFGADRG